MAVLPGASSNRKGRKYPLYALFRVMWQSRVDNAQRHACGHICGHTLTRAVIIAGGVTAENTA